MKGEEKPFNYANKAWRRPSLKVVLLSIYGHHWSQVEKEEEFLHAGASKFHSLQALRFANSVAKRPRCRETLNN